MLTPILILSVTLFAPAPQQDLKARFESLDEARKHDEIVALFRENPARVMYLIDSYLEGSLSVYEKANGAPSEDDQKKIAAMHARAVRGATAAAEAFHSPDIVDYASSFVGWDADQKKQFRGGQQACGLASRSLKAKKYDEALEHAKTGLDRAWPLGDWWGSAMAMRAMGKAYHGLGKHEDALRSLSTARIFNHGLALYRSAYRCDREMIPVAIELGRFARAEVTIKRALGLADEYNDRKGMVTLLGQHATVLEKTGRSEEAAAARTKADALSKELEAESAKKDDKSSS